MRNIFRSRVIGATFVALALVATACGSGDDVADGSTITVGSFNFPESQILAEIYAQTLEANDYPIEKKLNLGSRELIFPSLKSGEIDLLPEYLGSSLGVGFGIDSASDADSVATALSDAFAAEGVTVLQYAPGEDKNVFVVTQEFAAANNLVTISDLAGVADLTLGGPPECENRDTCYGGLTGTYGLSQLKFESIQEGAARIAALENGEIDVGLLFSTQPVIVEKGFVALEDDQVLIRAENIVPVLNLSIADEYGSDLTNLIDSVTAKITTDVLLELNGKVENEGLDPDAVAKDWLTSNGFL